MVTSQKVRYNVITLLHAPDVFAKFKDEQGNFAANNPLEVLSLYNAAYLRTNGEIILDEAASFTKRSLELVLTNLQGPLAREVKCALEIPFPRRVRIYEAKYYISMHGQANEVIMELAKLNSNIVNSNISESSESSRGEVSDLIKTNLYLSSIPNTQKALI